MKLGQLKKKVIREFQKSPAKTCVLIGLCPVALYFIVPLFLGSKSKVDQKQAAQVIAIDTSTTLTTALPAMPIASGTTWQQLDGWMDADELRKAGHLAIDMRSPFKALAVRVKKADPVKKATPTIKPRITQDDFLAMGFKLTSTWVGGRTRSATINGQRYLEGGTVRPKSGGGSAAGEDAFLVRHVGAGHAILELDGERFRLEPARRGITVVRNENGALD